MYKGTHDHEQRNTITRASSPVHKYVSKYVNFNLTETQIKSLLKIDCPTASISPNQLSNLINYARRKANPEILSVPDFNQWCINHAYDVDSLHSTFVPCYYINDINDMFVLFNYNKTIIKGNSIFNSFTSRCNTNLHGTNYHC